MIEKDIKKKLKREIMKSKTWKKESIKSLKVKLVLT